MKVTKIFSTVLCFALTGSMMMYASASGSSDVVDPVEIKMAAWNSSAGPIYEEAAEKFNERQDKIHFTVEMQPGDYSQYLGAKTVSNDLPDLFFLSPYSQVSDFAENGRILDLSDQPFVSRIYENTKASVTHDDKIYAYPMNQEFWGVFYNIDLFEKAGITKIPETFSELKTVCEELQAQGITPFAATYKDSWTTEQIFTALFAQNMGSNLNEWTQKMNNGEESFQQEGVERVFAFLDLMKEYSGKNIMDADSTAGYNSFANGDAAMIFLGQFALRSAQKVNPEIKVGMFAAPISENPGEAKVISNVAITIAVNKNSEHLEEALEVLDFLSDNTDTDGWISTVFDSYGSPMPCMDFDIKNIKDESYYISASEAINNGDILKRFVTELPTGITTDIGNIIQGYFTDTETPETVIQKLDETMANYLQ